MRGSHWISEGDRVVFAGFAGNADAQGLAVFAAGAAEGLQEGAGGALQSAGFQALSVEVDGDDAGAAQDLDLLAGDGAGFKLDGNRRGAHGNRDS